MATSSFTSIAVLGYDINTPEVLKASVALGFMPRCLYAPTGSVSPGTKIILTHAEIKAMGPTFPGVLRGDKIEIDVVTAEEFSRYVSENNIPVVIGSYGLREHDYFRNNLLLARHKLNITGPVLHPSFLNDFHINPARRYSVIGFPGSGNMIFQNICAKLFPDPAAPLWAINPLAAAVSQFALSYWYSLANFIAGAFDDMGRWHDQSGPTHMRFGAIHIDLGNEKSPAVVAGLPQRSYVWSNPWHTNHEPLTPASLSFFTKQNFFTFQIVRHPLDLVVSNAAKITALAGERAPQLLLQNDEWMEGMLKTVEAYFAEMVKCKNAPGVEFVSYEELLSTPVPTIRKLAETMEVKGNDKTYEKIWNELKNKTLSHDAGHLWDPRADKWREFIPARFAKRICNSPLRDYAAQFGYRLEEKDFMENQAGIPNSVSEPLHIAWRDAQWGAPIGKIPISHPDLYRVDDRESGLLLACGKRYAPAMERLRTSPMLRDLMAASGYKGWQEPSLITDCLGLR